MGENTEGKQYTSSKNELPQHLLIDVNHAMHCHVFPVHLYRMYPCPRPWTRSKDLKPVGADLSWAQTSVLYTCPKCAKSCSADASLYYWAHLHMYWAVYTLLFTSCCRCTFHPLDLRAPCFSQKSKTTTKAAIWHRAIMLYFSDGSSCTTDHHISLDFSRVSSKEGGGPLND